jgi:NADPH:quinone reductase-like Zn-dependent oxidoreductase
MKAAVYTRYGPPDVVQITDVEKPVPKDHEVLIRVRAASVNPGDWHFMRGAPYFLRIMTGLRKPKVTRLGIDVAGQVEAVGRNVTQFKPGNEVFGACRGAFAEYACTSESSLVTKPNNVTFEQAGSVPVAALTALQGLRNKGQIQPGQKILINGAAGGVGTFAVQIAKWFGAHVTGVCSTRNVEMVRSIGADQVIDYTQEDFTKGTQRYDLMFDSVGNHSLSACRRLLNPKGIYIVNGGPNGQWTVREPEPGHVPNRTEQRGLDHSARSPGVRKSNTGHRQALQVERGPRGYPVSGRRARSGKSGNNFGRKQQNVTTRCTRICCHVPRKAGERYR